MIGQMSITLSDTEMQTAEAQCQYCKLWDVRLGCAYYPLTPDFADNRPVDKCVVFEENKL